MGIGPAKSTTVLWVDTPHPWDYVRGLWDGDGSFWLSMKTSPVAEFGSSSKHLFDGMSQFLNDQGLPHKTQHKPTQKGVDYWRLRTNVPTTRRLAEKLYARGPYIQRKRNRALKAAA